MADQQSSGLRATGKGAVRRRRRFDPAGPVTGLFFLVMAGLFLTRGLTGGDFLAPATLVPVVLIGLGLVGSVRVLTRAHRRDLR